MKKSIQQKLEKGKRNLSERLAPRNWEEQDRPMFQGANITYEIAGRTQALDCGGLGAIHTMVQKLGLPKAIDKNLVLLKRHLPYHESDHILNMAYNILTGGICLEDLELRRNNETYMNVLGGQRIPDRKEGERVLRMEFKTFLNALIRIPCQIVRTGRRLVYRFLGYTPWLENFFETWEVLRGLRVT